MISQVHWDTHQMLRPHHNGFLLHGHKVLVMSSKRKGLAGVGKEALLGSMALLSRSFTVELLSQGLSQGLTIIGNHVLH